MSTGFESDLRDITFRTGDIVELHWIRSRIIFFTRLIPLAFGLQSCAMTSDTRTMVSEDSDGANKTSILTPDPQGADSFMTVQSSTQKSESTYGQAQDDSNVGARKWK